MRYTVSIEKGFITVAMYTGAALTSVHTFDSTEQAAAFIRRMS